MLFFTLSKSVNFPEHFLLRKPLCYSVIWSIMTYPTGKCYPFSRQKNRTLLRTSLCVGLRKNTCWGALWHFTPPENQIENLHNNSMCFAFSYVISSPMPPLPATCTQTQACKQIHRYTQTCTIHTPRHSLTYRDQTQIHLKIRQTGHYYKGKLPEKNLYLNIYEAFKKQAKNWV